jgi:Domain of unknown function (DUF6265)
VIGRLAAVVAVLCAVLLATAAQQSKSTYDKVSWIAGCWEGAMGSGKTQEQWMKPEGDSMLGMSRTVVNGKTPFFEFLQIKRDGEDLVYIARPQGKEPTPFKLVKLNDSAAVFENLEHDFPQRIAYQRQIDGSLLAAIEGVEKGKPKRVEFPMQRVKCD